MELLSEKYAGHVAGHNGGRILVSIPFPLYETEMVLNGILTK